jgi:hypothetical protein
MRSGEYRSVDQSSVAGEDVGCFILDKKKQYVCGKWCHKLFIVYLMPNPDNMRTFVVVIVW